MPKEVPKKPYSNLFHPHKTWADVILSFLVPYMLPLGKLSSVSTNASNAETMELVGSLRQTIEKMASSETDETLKNFLTKALGDVFRNYAVLQAPIKQDILSSVFGFDDATLASLNNSDDDDDGTAEIRLSVTSLSWGKNGEEDHKVDAAIDLESLDADVPVLVWFHSGGLCLGNERDDYLYHLLKELKMEDKESSSKSLVVVSVDMRLAPENPFPAAIIDCLSATLFVLERSSSKSIHIGGVSAGGYCASVTALEMHRKFPGKIKSTTIIDPMISPYADSESYLLNSTSSGVCPVEFLRWGWRSYLSIYEETEHNRQLIDNCKWRNSELWRMCNLLDDVPSDLSGPLASKFLVSTALACPLHDEGVEFVEKLRSNGATLDHIEARGSHCIALSQLDIKARTDFLEKFKRNVFGSNN
uniref:Alpha/beta hydrolase fold-3 domain-containing protein n=1 Tax=Ditylum brightwellii TaxID=49249 RepID=A0A7S1ZFW9_9STRA|mmetsp:Transcript_31116/g.46384  ORF Transcript_31116/g.46384 Transcript_31116/m.46384 type:complete len:417 (+) Transcript_31116:133-1383(+)